MAYKESGFVVEYDDNGEKTYLHIDKREGTHYFRRNEEIMLYELIVENTIKGANDWIDVHLRCIDSDKTGKMEVKKFCNKYAITDIN